MELWDILCQELKMTYRMLPPTDTGYGALLANGTWIGMVGQLEAKVGARREADSATCC